MGAMKPSGATPPELSVAPGLRWDVLAPTRDRLWLVLGGWAGVSLISAATMIAMALMGASGIMVGGDFVVFHVAAKGAAAGDAAALYEAGAFQAQLNAAFPGRNDLGLTWQYPPTYLLAIALFAGLPYLAGYALFSGASAGAFAFLLRKQVSDDLVFFAIIASPAAFIALTTGQNGFLFAALLILAARNTKTQPIIAGVAAGVITMKPHLGLLIPVAYLAAGCWRAAFVAAATALTLGAISLIAYGAAPWFAFLDAVFEVSGQVGAAMMPLAKMTTPYSAALFAGLSPIAAAAIHLVLALSAAAFVWRVWRKCADAELRASALIACVFLAAPYGFYYELIVLGFPVAIIVMRALKTGWLKHERSLTAAAWILSASVPFFADFRFGVSAGFLAMLCAVALVLRRAHAASPSLFPWPAPTANARAGA
ncbi:MAG: glycosyltransferase family 87 protein [Pseudomonadota bacterium]